jgi:hypothetical protein
MGKATTNIKSKEDQTRYKKTPSGKYVPANDPWAYEGLSEGWWLIKVQPGSTSIRQCVHPDNAELQAAQKDAEEKIVGILHRCLEARPKASQISPEFARAWKRLSKKYSQEMLLLEYPSLYEAAEKILNELFSIKSSQQRLRNSSPRPGPKTTTPANIWQ